MFDADSHLTATEREAAWIARKMNVSTGATFRKWERRADYLNRALVDRLRPLIAELDKVECYAEAERKAVMEVRASANV